MKSVWGWRHARGRRGTWTFLSQGSFGVAVPWITLLLLVVLLRTVGGSLAVAEGVAFDLPEDGLAEREKTDLVALALAMPSGTLVFFDDARYVLADAVSAAAFGERLGERVRASDRPGLLVLADRSVGAGDLMKLATIARMNGVRRVLFANKTGKEPSE